MPRFPRTETDLAELIEKMLEGLASSPKHFPGSDLPGLRAAWERYRETKQRQAAAFEAYRAATVPKDEALDALIAKTKAELKQAEIDTKDDGAKLRKIGWSDNTTSEEVPLPGTPQGVRFATGRPRPRLEWAPPGRGVGGKVQVYEVERRPLTTDDGAAEWSIAGVALETFIDLPEQPSGVQEFRVISRNKKGTSEPSSSVFLA